MAETVYQGETKAKNPVFAIGTAVQGWHKVAVEAAETKGVWNVYGAEKYCHEWQAHSLLAVIKATTAREAANKAQLAVEAIIAGMKK